MADIDPDAKTHPSCHRDLDVVERSRDARLAFFHLFVPQLPACEAMQGQTLRHRVNSARTIKFPQQPNNLFPGRIRSAHFERRISASLLRDHWRVTDARLCTRIRKSRSPQRVTSNTVASSFHLGIFGIAYPCFGRRDRSSTPNAFRPRAGFHCVAGAERLARPARRRTCSFAAGVD